MLPGVNGYRLCSTLRREGNWTSILMLTAKEGEWDGVEALDNGADDYLTKPYSYAVLLALLKFLLRRRSEAVPKREILQHVWDDEFEGDPNIVEVYVGHLRNKLVRPFGRAGIQTVRGTGYRLVPDGG
jgi:DNA-binding response OmpR family regulator